jgi:hypothetical protein
MEAEMNRAGFELSGTSHEPESNRNSEDQRSGLPEVTADELETSRLLAEKLSTDTGRFFGLSSELTELLANLSREVKLSAEQLTRIRAEADLKKKELKDLHGIEVSVAALERLAAEQQRQKESLDRLIADQRAQWEGEKARRTQEEKDYAENLRIRHEREEEEYRQRWAVEKLQAQQKLEEELRNIQQERLQKLQALERDCLERELVLKEKELEWVQLIQELEQFMSKLTRRTHAQSSTRLGPAAMESPAQSPVQTEEHPELQYRKAPESADIASLKEMLMSQGRRIENLKE